MINEQEFRELREEFELKLGELRAALDSKTWALESALSAHADKISQQAHEIEHLAGDLRDAKREIDELKNVTREIALRPPWRR